MTERVAARRVHTGTFAGEQMQRTAQDVARRANDHAGRLETLEDLVPVNAVLRVDFTTTAATAQDTLLAFDVEDGDMWTVEYWGLAGVTGSANGMKYAIKAPASSVVTGTIYSSLTSSTDFTTPTISAPNVLTAALHTVAGGTRPDHIHVRVRVVGTGQIAIQACSTTAGNTTTILAGAQLRATRYTEVG